MLIMLRSWRFGGSTGKNDKSWHVSLSSMKGFGQGLQMWFNASHCLDTHHPFSCILNMNEFNDVKSVLGKSIRQIQLFYNGALINCEMLFMAKWWLPSHHQFDPCPPDLTESWQLADRNATSPAWLTNTVFSFLALSHCRLIWRGYKQPLDESDLLELNEEDKAEYWVSAFEKKWREEISHAAGYATTLTSI